MNIILQLLFEAIFVFLHWTAGLEVRDGAIPEYLGL